MRLAHMLKLYATCTQGMSLQRIASETDVPLRLLHDWINGDETALCARQFARLQCWTFSRAPKAEAVRADGGSDSEGGEPV